MSKNFSGKLSRGEREEWARRVKSLRQARGMTQEELADATESSRTTIIGLEAGTSVPQSEKLVSILMHLGVDVFETRFGQETELWLSMMGTLIEAIPTPRRLPVVNDAIQVLARGIEGGRAGRVTPIRSNDSGFLDDALHGLDTAAGKDETQADEFE